jgi:hypothetical protein
MASNYPTSIDTFTNPSAGASLSSPSHSTQHGDANDAIEAIEAKVGIGSSPASAASEGAVLKANGSGSTTWQKAGLWLVKSDTLTSGATKEITSAFNSTFENYRIVISFLQINTIANIFFRFGTTTTGYYGTYYYDKFDGAATGTVRKNNGGELQIGIAENLVNNWSVTFDVAGPNTTAAHKGINGTHWGGGYSGWFAGVIANSTQFTSFTLGTSGGAFTAGNVRVYGYQN